MYFTHKTSVCVYTDSLRRINMKARRQSAILDVVEHEAVRNQEQLRQRLAARGFAVTQATLSRDIKELGLLKRSADGAYQPSSVDNTPQITAFGTLARALSEYLVTLEPVQQLVVVRTGAGQAQLLGLAIDRAKLPEVVGTLAGDDTILVIARDPGHALAVVKRLQAFADE